MCDKTKPCTLEIIASDYKEELFALIDGYGFSVYGNMEIVILDAQETIDINKNIQNIRLAYTDKNEFDENKIVKGLFVKVNSKETLGADLYFNFALEFNEEQKSDIVVFANETEEIWLLEVVEGNKTIVFEYGVLYRYFFVN